jgi:radical SAM protein with 4Fe4S-binding SPASM domain
VYNKIRIGSDFDKVVKNISFLDKLKKEKGSKTPMLRFNFVLMKSNIHELPDFIDLAASLGVEEVQTQHMVIFVQQMQDEALVFYKAESNASILEAKARAKVHKIRFYHPPLFSLDSSDETSDSKPAPQLKDGKIWMKEDDFDFERKTHPVLRDGLQLCTDPWRKIFIDWQGLVFPCCVWKEEPLGDLRRNTFMEIWESPRYRQLREGLTSGKLGKSCAECSVITGGDINSEQSYFFAQNA